MDCEREISAKCENESDSNVSKNGSLSENCKALNAESASTGQPVVISDENSQNIGSRHHPAVAKESDGGWGWVIVLGALLINTLVGGVTICFAVLYMEFVDMFDASRAVIGWIGSLHFFTSNILGITSVSYSLLT